MTHTPPDRDAAPPRTAPPAPADLPDLSRYASGSDGVPYLVTLRSGHDGPHAMISALVHGNELCGAIALDRLLRNRLQPRRGRLTLAFMNVEAFHSNPPRRFLDEDMNRVWAPEVLAGDRDSRELRRARQVRPVVDTVDLLLDLHSMQSQDAPIALSGDWPKGARLARTIGVPATIVQDPGHPAGPRLRDYAQFGDPAADAAAVLVECGQHAAPAAATLAQDAALRLLLALDMIAPAEAERLNGGPLGPAATPQRLVRVTGLVTAGHGFRMADEVVGMCPIPKAGTIVCWNEGTAIGTPYDDCVPVMPTPGATSGTTALRFGQLQEVEGTEV
ncbi:MAG: succinylglutamate desuccinylase/aspartoacylase family protein [Sneathiellaceae bacterium]